MGGCNEGLAAPRGKGPIVTKSGDRCGGRLDGRSFSSFCRSAGGGVSADASVVAHRNGSLRSRNGHGAGGKLDQGRGGGRPNLGKLPKGSGRLKGNLLHPGPYVAMTTEPPFLPSFPPPPQRHRTDTPGRVHTRYPNRAESVAMALSRGHDIFLAGKYASKFCVSLPPRHVDRSRWTVRRRMQREREHVGSGATIVEAGCRRPREVVPWALSTAGKEAGPCVHAVAHHTSFASRVCEPYACLSGRSRRGTPRAAAR